MLEALTRATVRRSVVSLAAFLALSACTAAAQTDFGTVNVGESKILPVTVTFPRTGSFDRIAVVTKGAPNLDFTDAGGGTCVAGSVYAAGENCMLNVALSPRSAGPRMGAVVLYAGRQPVVTAFILGAGSSSGHLLSEVPGDMAGLPWASDQAAPTAGIISTVAGHCDPAALPSCKPGYGGDGGPATSGELGGPYGIAIDGAGNLYIADTGNSVVRKVDTSGTISTAAGHCDLNTENACAPGYSGDGGEATSAKLSEPFSIAVDGRGNLTLPITESL